MNYSSVFESIRERCVRGRTEDIDFVLGHLQPDVELPVTKAIDYFLGFAATEEAIGRIEFYLFHGTQMQRNYCTLYFARRDEWKVVNKAYDMGLVDRFQAYSR